MSLPNNKNRLNTLLFTLKTWLIALSIVTFSPGSLAQTQDSINLAQQMYVAYYGRPGDPGGITWWATQFDESASLDAALSAFGDSQEFGDNFGELSNEELVNGLFLQMYNRDADSAGLAFYVGRLESGAATLASIAKQIADGSQENDLTALNNKISVANTFTNRVESEAIDYVGSDIPDAQALIADITFSAVSLAAGESAVGQWAEGKSIIQSTIALGVSVLDQMQENAIQSEIISLDLNEDGFNDLVFHGTSHQPFYVGNKIIALVNNKDGTFDDQTEQYFPGYDESDWTWVSRVFFADINNDGRLDMSHYSDGLRGPPPFIRQDDGSFKALESPALDGNVSSLLPMDIDKDGDIDFVSMRIAWDPAFDEDNVHLFRLIENTTTANGELTFVSHPEVLNDNVLAGEEYFLLVRMPLLVDINNDGFQDIVYQGPHYKDGWTGEEKPVIVFMNTGNNTFEEKADEVFSGNIPYFVHNAEIAAADIDGSGNQSIVMANTGFDTSPYIGEPNAVLKNNGNGTLETDLGTFDTHNYLGFSHSMTIGDIDNDGDEDIIYVGGGQDVPFFNEDVRILKNDGAGNFTNQFFVMEGPFGEQGAGGRGFTTCLIADLNNDDFPELVLGSASPGTETLILWNDGTGQYSTEKFQY